RGEHNRLLATGGDAGQRHAQRDKTDIRSPMRPMHHDKPPLLEPIVSSATPLRAQMASARGEAAPIVGGSAGGVNSGRAFTLGRHQKARAGIEIAPAWP